MQLTPARAAAISHMRGLKKPFFIRQSMEFSLRAQLKQLSLSSVSLGLSTHRWVCISLLLPVECMRRRRLHFRAAHTCSPLISPCGALNAPETPPLLHNSPRRPRAPGSSGEIAGLEEQLFGQSLMRDCKNRPTRRAATTCARFCTGRSFNAQSRRTCLSQLRI
jgi:hypothetical protein